MLYIPYIFCIKISFMCLWIWYLKPQSPKSVPPDSSAVRTADCRTSPLPLALQPSLAIPACLARTTHVPRRLEHMTAKSNSEALALTHFRSFLFTVISHDGVPTVPRTLSSSAGRKCNIPQFVQIFVEIFFWGVYFPRNLTISFFPDKACQLNSHFDIFFPPMIPNWILHHPSVFLLLFTLLGVILFLSQKKDY